MGRKKNGRKKVIENTRDNKVIIQGVLAIVVLLILLFAKPVFIPVFIPMILSKLDNSGIVNKSNALNNKKDPRTVLQEYLQKKYNEEFVIEYLGLRTFGKSQYYEGAIYPKSYIGTSKMEDEYYSAKGYITDGKPGDNYNKVHFTDDTSEYFRPKLEELFGKNVLSIFNFEAAFGYLKYEEMKRQIGAPALRGTIYIFGSPKNEKDRLHYRDGIFKFVQYLKEIDNYKLSELSFVIIDERVLEDDYYDLNLKAQLVKAKRASKTAEEFIVKRERIMRDIEVTSSDKRERIAEINRWKLGGPDKIGHMEYFGFVSLLGEIIVSPERLETAEHLRKNYSIARGHTHDSKEEIEIIWLGIGTY